MRHANRSIRRVLYAFVVVVPLLVILTHAFGELIARLTTIP
jgi:hypothetical protein